MRFLTLSLITLITTSTLFAQRPDSSKVTIPDGYSQSLYCDDGHETYIIRLLNETGTNNYLLQELEWILDRWEVRDYVLQTQKIGEFQYCKFSEQTEGLVLCGAREDNKRWFFSTTVSTERQLVHPAGTQEVESKFINMAIHTKQRPRHSKEDPRFRFEDCKFTN